MPNIPFAPLVSNLEYTPTSYEDYMKPYVLAENLYQARKKDLDDRADALAAYLPYINDGTPEAKALYDAFQEQLDRNVEQIGRRGWNLNMEPHLDLKNQYRITNSKLKKAAEDLEELRKADKEDVRKDPSLLINYKDAEGNFIQPNIDNMLRNDASRHFVSEKTVQANAAAAAKALSDRTVAAFSMMKTVYMNKTGEPRYGYYDSTTGEFKGCSSQVLMDWMMSPENHQKEINEYLDFVGSRGGADARTTMSALFNGDFRNAMQTALDMTDYSNMSKENKLRINNALWLGAYQGLVYDEKLVKNRSNWAEPGSHGGGGGGGAAAGAIETPVTNEATTGQIFVPAEGENPKAVQEGRDRLKSLSNFLNLDTSSYYSDGLINFRDNGRYSIANGRRTYSIHDSDAQRNRFGDKFIDDPNVLNAGVKDYFSLFDDNGNLFTEDGFVDAYKDVYNEILSDEYFNKYSSDANFGDLYKTSIRGKSANSEAQSAGAVGASGEMNPGQISVDARNEALKQYSQIKHMVLDAFDVSDKEQEKLLNDKTAFDKWLKDNNVNEATLQNAIYDMWDKYSNVKTNLQYLTFGDKKEEVARKVLQSTHKPESHVFSEDTQYKLNPIDPVKGYVFEIKNVNGEKFKELRVEPGPEREFTSKELFTDIDDGKVSYSLQYRVPVNPMQGLIVEFPSGVQALIKPDLLGSSYPAQAIQDAYDNLKLAEAKQHACVERIKGFNKEFYDYKQGGHSQAEIEAKKAEVAGKMEQAHNMLKLINNTIINIKTGITETLVSSLSSGIYKTDVQ